MPIYEYRCQKCDHLFEALVLGAQKASCPRCESQRLEKQFSAFGVGRGELDTPCGRPARDCDVASGGG